MPMMAPFDTCKDFAGTFTLHTRATLLTALSWLCLFAILQQVNELKHD
jgi:hypothetical protein